MLTYAIILFISALLAGLAVLKLPQLDKRVYKLSLVFAGSYLFSITVIHLLPELFSVSSNPAHVGMYVLAGFFLQLFLEYFTSGVEHGHLHGIEEETEHHHHHFQPITLLLALCIHAFLEGTLLIHPDGEGHSHNTDTLLAGVVLHKMPAAFALMSVLIHQVKSLSKAVVMLIIFSLTSPLGLFFSEYLQTAGASWEAINDIVYPLVAGSFLHISTTIFIENSPEHNFNLHKLIASLIAASLAILSELLA